MVVGSGLSLQVGIGREASYGAYQAPSVFLEILSEGIKAQREALETRGIGDQWVRTGRRRPWLRRFAGPIEMDFMSKGMELLLEMALGVVAGTTTLTFTPDTTGLAGKSLTVQVGKPEAAIPTTVVPFNYLGGKITEFTLNQQLDQNLKFTPTFDFKPVDDIATALGTASYPASNAPLSFMDASVTLDTVAVCLQQVSITSKRAFADDRRCLGNTKLEPIPNGEWMITGQFQKEFTETAIYEKFISGALAALVMTHSYGGASLVTTIPALEYTGGDPEVNGSDLLRQTIPFKALYNGTNPIMTLAYTPAT
jgi:hypothetical protein